MWKACSRKARAVLLAMPAFLAAVPSVTASPLVLETYFRQPAVATGMFRNAMDGTVRNIAVPFRGRWEARTRTLVLSEDIRYSDGGTERKVWRLTKTGSGTYVGTRADILGEAKGFTDVQGRVHLQYRALVGARTLSFDDVLARQPDGTVLNRARVSYLFIHVGDVELRVRRPGR